MTNYRILIVTPVSESLSTQQWELFYSQAHQLRYQCELAHNVYPNDHFTIRHVFIAANPFKSDIGTYVLPNVTYQRDYMQATGNQTKKRAVATHKLLPWLKDKEATQLLVWLDADDVPSAWYLEGLLNCVKPLNVLAVSRPAIATFTTQYVIAGKRAFGRLTEGASGVTCGSAIAWRVDLVDNPWLTAQLRLHEYEKYNGIEDVVLGITVARKQPDSIGYVTAHCCQDYCNGYPVVYHTPSYQLGATDNRQERNQLLAKYRQQTNTPIQGIDSGYGEI